MNIEELKEELCELEVAIEDFDLEEEFTEDDFANELDETEEPVYVYGCEFLVSDILINMDPIAFSQAYFDFLNELDPSDFPRYVELVEREEEIRELLEELEDE